jgi:gas vesicle protein
VSDRESHWGSFMTGLAVGVVLALLFAPEPGEELRGKLGRRLAKMRDLAADQIAEEDEPSV